MKRRILKIMKWALVALLGAVAVLVIWNFICKKAEQSKVEAAYGRTVEVNGHNMTADIKGEDNEITVILLPGWGSPSPVLEFLQWRKNCQRIFRVLHRPLIRLSNRLGTNGKITRL